MQTKVFLCWMPFLLQPALFPDLVNWLAHPEAGLQLLLLLLICHTLTTGLTPCLTSARKNVVKRVEIVISIQVIHAVIHVVLLYALVSVSHNNTSLKPQTIQLPTKSLLSKTMDVVSNY